MNNDQINILIGAYLDKELSTSEEEFVKSKIDSELYFKEVFLELKATQRAYRSSDNSARLKLDYTLAEKVLSAHKARSQGFKKHLVNVAAFGIVCFTLLITFEKNSEPTKSNIVKSKAPIKLHSVNNMTEVGMANIDIHPINSKEDLVSHYLKTMNI